MLLHAAAQFYVCFSDTPFFPILCSRRVCRHCSVPDEPIVNPTCDWHNSALRCLYIEKRCLYLEKCCLLVKKCCLYSLICTRSVVYTLTEITDKISYFISVTTIARHNSVVASLLYRLKYIYMLSMMMSSKIAFVNELSTCFDVVIPHPVTD